MAENPYVNKVQKADGSVIIDLSNDTVTPSDVLNGVTFHDRSGTPQTGSIITHNVYNGLDSTSITDALSANQGKELNESKASYIEINATSYDRSTLTGASVAYSLIPYPFFGVCKILFESSWKATAIVNKHNNSYGTMIYITDGDVTPYYYSTYLIANSNTIREVFSKVLLENKISTKNSGFLEIVSNYASNISSSTLRYTKRDDGLCIIDGTFTVTSAISSVAKVAMFTGLPEVKNEINWATVTNVSDGKTYRLSVGTTTLNEFYTSYPTGEYVLSPFMYYC